jgi:hypothetical protein
MARICAQQLKLGSLVMKIRKNTVVACQEGKFTMAHFVLLVYFIESWINVIEMEWIIIISFRATIIADVVIPSFVNLNLT